DAPYLRPVEPRHHIRIETSARSGADLLERSLDLQRLPVRARLRQCVVDVRHADDAALDGYLRRRQVLGVAAPVPTLVVGIDDETDARMQRLARPQYVGAILGVLLLAARHAFVQLVRAMHAGRDVVVALPEIVEQRCDTEPGPHFSIQR